MGSFDWKQFAGGAATSAASGLIGGAFGLIGARVQRKQQEKLMAKQFDYDRQAFEMENARQDWLLKNSALLQKQGLERAGYSTADPEGTGFQLAGTNTLDTPSVPSSSFNPFNVDVASSMQALSQVRLAQAQEDNIKANTDKTIKETEGQSIDNYLKQTYGDAQWQAAIKNLDSQTAQNVANEAYLTQKKINEKNLTDVQIDSIEKHLDWDYQKLDPELKLLAAQAYQLSMSGDLSHTEISQVWQNIKESAQRVDNLKKELGLTDAQITVATNLANNYAKENNILGYQTTSAKAQAELDQFNRDLTKSMGLRFYKAKRVAEAVLPIGATAAVLGKAFGLGK